MHWIRIFFNSIFIHICSLKCICTPRGHKSACMQPLHPYMDTQVQEFIHMYKYKIYKIYIKTHACMHQNFYVCLYYIRT